MDLVLQVMPALLRGAEFTILVAVQAGILAVLISIVVGVLRAVSGTPVNFIIGIYVEFFRGTSAFVQIYWAYFALPLLGVRLSALEAGIAVLALNVGAYGSEVVRGALKAIPPGQREACTSLGLPIWVTYAKVLLPQAMARTVLPMGNLLIDLVKGTSLLSAITVTELAFAGRQAVSAFGSPFQIFAMVLVLYLIISAPIAWGARLLDRRLRGSQRTAAEA
jgi:polar amino acid transport system permease protein